jgi:hypothetical protein
MEMMEIFGIYWGDIEKIHFGSATILQIDAYETIRTH